MNARYYDPVTGQFVSPDTLVPDATNLFDYNRYMYVRGNPLKYTDPTGHFSEEQLNWLGIYEDKVSESVWELLLKLEPFERVNVREDRIGQVVFGANLREGDAQIYLEFLVGGERRGAVEWLTANEGLLSGASIRRLVGSEYKEVWRDGTLVAPEYEHSLGQAGFIIGPQGAAANRFFNGLGGEGIAWLIGLVPGVGAPASMVYGAASNIEAPGFGCLEGDVYMAFIFPHPEHGARQPIVRHLRMRANLRNGLAIEQSWETPPPVPVPFSRKLGLGYDALMRGDYSIGLVPSLIDRKECLIP